MKLKIPLTLWLLAALYPLWGADYGVLISKKGAMMSAPVKGFKSVVGASITEYNMEGKNSTGADLCAKLKADNPKAVLVVGKSAAKAAAKNLPGVPLVYCMVMNPKKAGVSGGQATGISLNIPMNKQFESFKQVVPGIKNLGMIYSSKTSSALANEMKSAAEKMGMVLVEKKVADAKGVPNAVRELKGKIEGLYLPPDRNVVNRDAFQFIALHTFENNLPFMAPTSRFVKKGALVAVMIDYEELGKQAAGMAKSIAGGKAASAIPPQTPQATILVLNQKTAKTIGINIPPALMGNSQIIK